MRGHRAGGVKEVKERDGTEHGGRGTGCKNLKEGGWGLIELAGDQKT